MVIPLLSVTVYLARFMFHMRTVNIWLLVVKLELKFIYLTFIQCYFQEFQMGGGVYKCLGV